MAGRNKAKRIPKKARDDAYRQAIAGGQSLAEFAREKGVDYQAVIYVLNGTVYGTHGKGYAAAVALGLRQ
ncbi:MAG: hypothetical protein ACR2PR_09120 [Pseudohongiellaceae bacterium]